MGGLFFEFFMEQNLERLNLHASFIPRRGMKLSEVEKGVVATRDKIKQKIMSYPDATELPESIIDNIVKVALEQNKLSDSKWFIKMLADAKKKQLQALEAKAKKETKKIEFLKKKEQELDARLKATKIRKLENQPGESPSDPSLSLSSLVDEQNKNSDPLFQKDELRHLLPYVKNLRSLYPNLKNITWFYILKNYGDWPLIVMTIFPEREKIFPNWTVQAAATLKEIGLKKILELELHKDPDALYRYMKAGGKYKKCFFHRVLYIKFLQSMTEKIKNARADENE